MRYHYEINNNPIGQSIFSTEYCCNHPVYNKGTLYLQGSKGLVVIQQYYSDNKTYYWSSINHTLADNIYMHPRFYNYFRENADVCKDGLYPTVTVRQIMWALRMKPLKKERWETVFDRPKI